MSEKETILNNVQNTIDILEIEKDIKILLNNLENKTNIESKIEIILKGNKLINKNQNIFKEYQDEFMQKSRDVLSFLQTTYNSYKEKVIQNYNFNYEDKNKDEIKEKEKENKDNIKEMEKYILLIIIYQIKKNFYIIFSNF